MIRSCCESLYRCFKNFFSSSSDKKVKGYVDLSEGNPIKENQRKSSTILNKSSNNIDDKEKFNFRDTCQKIIELFNLEIDISNKLSKTFEIKDNVEYKITISIKSKTSSKIENENALFNVSLDIENGKFKPKFNPVILDDINKVKSEFQIKKDIQLLKEKIGDLIINGKVIIIYSENIVIFRLDIKHPDELIESSDILEIKIEFKNPKIKNPIEIGKKIYNKFLNKQNLEEKYIIIPFLIIVFIMIIYYKINNSENFLYDLNKTIEESEKKDNYLDNYYYTSSSSNYN